VLKKGLAVNVRYFLDRRLEFIRQLYGTASAPYVERKRKIEAEEEPFVPPYDYDGDGEPSFLDEWIEADESLHVLACSCVSMLSASLRLYLETWAKESRALSDGSNRKAFKNGWISGYKAQFHRSFGIQFDVAPVNLARLEELVLARNCIEHPSSITSRRARYARADLKKLRHPFFVDEQEAAFLSDAVDGERGGWSILPTLHISAEQLNWAISEVGSFAAWFEVEIENRGRPR
jgi:hypothetical protein